MSLFKPVLAVLALGVLAGCTPFTIRYDYDSHANYASYKTFDWYAASPKAKDKAAGVENPLMDRRVRTAVERELTARGLKLEKSGEPDLLVTYYPVYKDRAVVTSTGIGGGWGWGWRPWGYGVGTRFHEVQYYKEGSIVLELVDGKTNQLIWQAAAEGALTGLEDPQDAEEQVGRAVKQMLDRFPPPAGR